MSLAVTFAEIKFWAGIYGNNSHRITLDQCEHADNDNIKE